MILQAIKSVHFNYKFHLRQQRRLIILTQLLRRQITNHLDQLQIQYQNISHHQKKKRKGLIVKLLSETSD